MSSSANAIRVEGLSKRFEIYAAPRDRLKQFVLPRLQSLAGQPQKRYFNEFWALNNVSFDIQKGETVGIIGRNGSGKSTLLQIICGTLSLTSGSIQTQGRVAALLELGAGFNPEFTGRENVYLNATILGLSQAEIDGRFDAIAAFADIGQFIEQPVKTYSSGMMVRLAFAVAINVDPEILIVDEALSVGDELFQRKCFSRIEAIRAKGATILFVSHSGGTIVELCNRAILLDAGELLCMGAPKQIVGRYQKLLYAPPSLKDSIRNAIHQTGDQPDHSDTGTTTADAHKAQLLETFDPNFLPSSTIELESNGARIESPKVLTLSGTQVNNLIRGKTYVYTYRVKFSKSAVNVRFGMMIKTTAGVELGGCATVNPSKSSTYTVMADSTIQVEFRFVCALNTGVYFLNAGVRGDVNGEQTILHRLVDVVVFRVQPDNDTLMTGTIDFSCYPEVALISPNHGAPDQP
jgi:lipopolysaccharide transport system ATP-binding protein